MQAAADITSADAKNQRLISRRCFFTQLPASICALKLKEQNEENYERIFDVFKKIWLIEQAQSVFHGIIHIKSVQRGGAAE
ncbi:hypothetical protein OK016_03700 [Vibrio chagasii]|nr:hypothetical protein [Vibrio chagasii]